MPPVGSQAYVKAVVAGTALCIGGPAFVSYITPTKEEIFQRYSPALQKEALARREKTQQEFDDFTKQLKEASKSDKPIWVALKQMDAKRSEDEQARLRAERDVQAENKEKRQAEIRESAK